MRWETKNTCRWPILFVMCAKNLCKRVVLLKLIIENVVTCFLEHSVLLAWKNNSAPYWNSTSDFVFGHITVLGMSLCIRLPNFVQIGPSSAEIRYYIDFEVGGRCGIILLPISDRRMYLFLEVSISKPNVVVITQSTAEIYLHHIGIIFPVSISTISPQSTSHSAPVCQISSKSNRSRHKNDVMSIFKLADFRHLGF